MSDPVTRKEQLLSSIATGGDIISPVTREEMYLAYMAGDTSVVLPEPVTRKEQFLYQACLNEGSGGGSIIPSGTKDITENGVYDVTAYASANVNVPTEEINNQDKTITENGEYTADAGFTGFGTVTVNVPTSSGGATPSAKWNDVTFIDYDGSVLYSYSLEEAQALTELPALPTHGGLICQGWNWTLDAIKALNSPVTVGAMYITDDGSTRLHIRIATVGRMNVPIYICQTVANGVSIDWGDGSADETIAGTGNVNISHEYSEPGDYIISLMPIDGCTLSLGNNLSNYCVMGVNGYSGRVYCSMLKDVSVGKNVTSIGDYSFSYCHSIQSITIPNSVTSIGDYAFSYCYSIQSITIPDSVTSIGDYSLVLCNSISSITIPNSVTSIGDYAFNNCYSIKSITIPDSVTSIGISAFGNCYSLSIINIYDGIESIEKNCLQGCYSIQSITIPNSVTSIGDYAFSNCYSIQSITIPDSVTSIGISAFGNCYGIFYYDFSECNDIPTLSNTSAFKNIASDCKMLIPAALFDTWKTATNWATYASYMVAV